MKPLVFSKQHFFTYLQLLLPNTPDISGNPRIPGRKLNSHRVDTSIAAFEPLETQLREARRGGPQRRRVGWHA